VRSSSARADALVAASACHARWADRSAKQRGARVRTCCTADSSARAAVSSVRRLSACANCNPSPTRQPHAVPTHLRGRALQTLAGFLQLRRAGLRPARPLSARCAPSAPCGSSAAPRRGTSRLRARQRCARLPRPARGSVCARVRARGPSAGMGARRTFSHLARSSCSWAACSAATASADWSCSWCSRSMTACAPPP
jgi:hypothetical protein